MKKNSKRGFTLVEMLVVIVIIGILMVIGLGLNWSSLDQIKAKSAREELTAFFDAIFLQINISNYQNQKVYTGIELTLSGGDSKFSYSYLGESSEIQNQSGDLFGNFIITGLTGDSSSLDLVKVRYRPFSPTCEINEGNVSSLSFSIRQSGKQDVCFKLESQYCKLQQVTCN